MTTASNEGQRLADTLRNQCSLDELSKIALSGDEFRDGFLIGKFGTKHSNVALYRASSEWNYRQRIA